MTLPLLLLLIAPSAVAAEPSARVYPSDGPIVVDGVLDEPGWSRAVPVTNFTRYTPAEGGAPAGTTEVRFLQDEDTLYIGVHVSDTGYPVRARISPREQLNADDQVGIYLDTFDDQRTGYIFYVSALGVQQDIRFNNGQWNMNWNTVLWTKGEPTDDGYVIEVAVPFRSLRYPEPDGPQTWGVILTRKIPSEGAKYAWPEVARNHPRLLSQAAPLQGVTPAPRGAGLEILPSLAVRQADTLQQSVRPGLDLRMSLGADSGAALTINPDFSQVEGDAAQIDLNQRFAFFYPERRPFFLDGIHAFQDVRETLYTRSIVEPLYGVKLSAQQGGLTVGALQALDRSPGASVNQEGAPGFSEEDIGDRWAHNSFGRLRLDAFDGGFVGLTAADKRLTDGGGYNDVLAADAVVPMGEAWTVSGAAAGSVTGDGIDTDSTMAGHDVGLIVERQVGAGWSALLSARDVGTGFRQEMGFLNQSAITTVNAEGGYTAEPEVAWIDAENTGFWAGAYEDRDGDHVREVGLFQWASLGGVHKPSVFFGLQDILQSDVGYQGWLGGVEYSAEPTKFLAFEVVGETADTLDFGELVPARSWSLDGEASVRIGAGVRLDLYAAQQWFTPEGLDTETATALRSRFFYQFTRTLGTRLIGQTTTGSGVDTPELATSYLVTWLRNPGTEAYIGATQRFLLEDTASLEETTLFAKLTWLFRV